MLFGDSNFPVDAYIWAVADYSYYLKKIKTYTLSDSLYRDIKAKTADVIAPDATYVAVNAASLKETIEKNPIIVQKIMGYAEKYGVPESIAVAVALQESNMKHFDSFGNVLTNAGGDYGMMQINKRIHDAGDEKCFTLLPSSERVGLCSNPSCDGKTAMDPECNIEAGVKYLKDRYDTCQRLYSSGYHYKCTSKIYSDWACALRGYNGFANDCSGTPTYVEEVTVKVAEIGKIS